ncbi:MAG: recombinase family protein [Sphingomonas fennica]
MRSRKGINTVAGGPIRCAIYTRKSTEEGLEQDFNSLDAQREACAAYILSQRHEGWVALPGIYDDGGYSGGTMERPALKALLAEVAADRVDVIVVYKVDRLTRSLADFAKIVEVLDKAEASFVSVTQSFNTTSSMGRLTLNVLLSFAQFEREVTGERIRDKIAASKAKGMWMGGPIPLGYRLDDRKLVIEPAEAETIRFIYRRFLELKSGRLLVAELDRIGIRSKPRSNRHGLAYGNTVISRGALYAMLKNPLYVGDVAHKGQIFVGQHEAIIEREQFDAVQAALATAAVDRRHGQNATEPSLLAGLMWDGLGRRMSPSHACKTGRRYRYYVSQTDGDAATATPPWRISAGDVEQLVLARLEQTLTARQATDIAGKTLSSDEIGQAQDAHDRTLAELRADAPSRKRAALLQHVQHIEVGEAALTMTLQDGADLTAAIESVRRGSKVSIIVPPRQDAGAAMPNPSLVKLIAQAFTARGIMDRSDSLDAVASEMAVGREYAADLVRTSYLAPSIVEAILNGAQPSALTRKQLMTTNRIPLGWDQQRVTFDFS